MLAVEEEASIAPDGVDPRRVTRAFQQWVLPAGRGALDQLEVRVEERFKAVSALLDTSPADLPGSWEPWLAGVLSARPYQSALLRETRWVEVGRTLQEARAGRHGARDLPELSTRLRGAPPGVCLDAMADLLHSAAPDRIPLLPRWVFNPAQGTGVLNEFARFPPRSYEEAQAWTGAIRLQLSALGFPSRTFAAVDLLFSLTYAGRIAHAASETFQGGGIETLLPGNLGLATLLLGIRGRRSDAHR